ncbi:GtrA family protein [Blastococcus sp. SYSU DS0619]
MAPLAQLRRLLRDGPSRLVRELSAFGVVGAVCFLVDVGLFQLLYAEVGLGAVTSKLLATLVSMSLAFVGHRFWSFSDRARTGLRREYTLFVVVNAAALLLGLAIIGVVRYPLGQDSALVLQGANLLSIGLGTVLRFLAYRRWVFVEEPAATRDEPPVAEPPVAERTR